MANSPLQTFREKQQPPLSREALARKLGVTRQTIWRWESGERVPDRELLPKISRMTGVPILKLMGMDQAREATE
jgi:transcriptional regulator with XRE-family HTH domain